MSYQSEWKLLKDMSRADPEIMAKFNQVLTVMRIYGNEAGHTPRIINQGYGNRNEPILEYHSRHHDQAEHNSSQEFLQQKSERNRRQTKNVWLRQKMWLQSQVETGQGHIFVVNS